MTKIDPKSYGANTNAIRAGQSRSNELEHSEPIFLSSSFVFQDAAEAAAKFSGNKIGNIYSRFTNPTVRAFEERLAVLEGGERCVATASGMSAILMTCMVLLQAGDEIVASRNIFGTTVGLFKQLLPKFGVTTQFVDLSDYDAWAQAITSNTKLLYLETPSNPLSEMADIRRLAELSDAHRCFLVVDNCFCTPVLQKPLALGADLVVHSATKYLDGQGRCVGGAVVGNDVKLADEMVAFLRTAGPTMSAFNAWVFLKGLETLSLRMARHSENALQLAKWLEQQPAIERVYYLGLASHRQHDLAKTQQSGFGGVVSFVVAGGKAAAWRVIDATQIFSITANLGDTRSTITHPATTTHHRLSDEERDKAGIDDGLVRLSVGFEDVGDLQADLARGLA